MRKHPIVDLEALIIPGVISVTPGGKQHFALWRRGKSSQIQVIDEKCSQFYFWRVIEEADLVVSLFSTYQVWLAIDDLDFLIANSASGHNRMNSGGAGIRKDNRVNSVVAR